MAEKYESFDLSGTKIYVSEDRSSSFFVLVLTGFSVTLFTSSSKEPAVGTFEAG